MNVPTYHYFQDFDPLNYNNFFLSLSPSQLDILHTKLTGLLDGSQTLSPHYGLCSLLSHSYNDTAFYSDIYETLRDFFGYNLAHTGYISPEGIWTDKRIEAATILLNAVIAAQAQTTPRSPSL